MASESSEMRTAVFRSPALGSEVVIPCPQTFLLVLADDPLDSTKFVS